MSYGRVEAPYGSLPDYSRRAKLGPPNDMKVSQIILDMLPQVNRDDADKLAIKIVDVMSAETKPPTRKEMAEEFSKEDLELARESVFELCGRAVWTTTTYGWPSIYFARVWPFLCYHVSNRVSRR